MLCDTQQWLERAVVTNVKPNPTQRNATQQQHQQQQKTGPIQLNATKFNPT